MTDLYLITGFLGAGKTTFLQNFLRLFAGRRVALIVNEFGRADVDAQLLKEQNAALWGVAGGSIFCACRLEQFESALSAALAGGPEVILVETSGLSDPTGVRRVLGLRAEFGAIAYKGCVCLTDPLRLGKLYGIARVCKKQLAVADCAVLNRLDLASEAEIREASDILARHLPPERVLLTTYGQIPPEWEDILLRLDASAPRDALLTNEIAVHALSLRVGEGVAPASLEGFLRLLCEECYRVKGVLKLGGAVWLVDCVGEVVRLAPAPDLEAPAENVLNVLYGYGQKPLIALKRAREWYPREDIAEA